MAWTATFVRDKSEPPVRLAISDVHDYEGGERMTINAPDEREQCMRDIADLFRKYGHVPGFAGYIRDELAALISIVGGAERIDRFKPMTAPGATDDELEEFSFALAPDLRSAVGVPVTSRSALRADRIGSSNESDVATARSASLAST
jgi:hypothetical protein